MVGTPIGNLSDVSERAADTLRAVDACFAEDTRRTGILLKSIGAETALRSLHEHNERARIDEVLTRLAEGQSVALVSDAGTPTISDPGCRLLAAAHEAGATVSPVPGPSAVLAALSVAGLPADRFFFAGFAPRRGRERKEWVAAIKASPDTCVAFEAPGRIAALLETLALAGLSERGGIVCRELTKIHEEVTRATIAELATVYGSRAVKGEVTLVIEGVAANADSPVDLAVVTALARDLAADGVSRRDIADRLGREYGLSRNEAYRASLVDEGGADDE